MISIIASGLSHYQGADIGPISCNYDQPSFFFEDEYCVSREYAATLTRLSQQG